MVANRPFPAALRRLASCALLAATLAFTPAIFAQVSNTATIAPPAGVTDPSGGCDTATPPVCSGNNTATDTDGLVRINAAKTPGAVSGPDGSGVYTVTYTVTVANTGNAAGTYGPLADSPVFPSHTSITGAAWTTSGAGAPPGGSSAAAGPYQLAPASTAIAAGATHTFNLSVTYRYVDSAPSNTCAATPTPGSGLYNAVTLGAGQETNTADNAACVVPPAPPALSIAKTASSAGFTVGVPASYTLSVQNIGGLPTSAVSTITDAIPAGLTIGTLPAGCTASGQTVTCTIAAGLAANATASFVIPVTPAAAAAGTTVNNTASVSGGGDFTCPGLARCSSAVSTPVAGAPQLTMTKTASAASFVVGAPASYTLSVQNTGTAATTAAATISDTIPTGLTIGTLPAGCTASGQTVTCTIAAGLAANASASFTVPVTATAAAQPSVTNTATVSGGGDAACPATARCTSSVTTPVNAPQLSLLKTASASPWTVGVPASYTLQLSNTGTAATTAAATITDTIPAGLTLGTLPAGCTESGQTVTCTVAAGLAAGASTSFVIPVTPTAAAQPSVTNTATVSGGGDATCPAAARCTSTAGPTPVNAPQLTMTKTGPASFTVGVASSYTLQVSNTGNAATTAPATITDTIPAGLTIGTLPAGCSASGQTVTCTIAAGLAAGGSTSFVIPVTATAAASNPSVNTATVSGGGDPTCPAAARCTSTVSTPVVAPQLTMTKTASSASFTVGVPASYTLSVQNTGTAATTAVATITDTIPAGLTIGTLPAGCTASGQTVTCTIAAGLAAGASTSFVIPVTATAAAQPGVTNTATVSGGGDATCPAAARCSSAVTTPVNAPQLTLTKTGPASFTVGVASSYTLQVGNTGNAATTAPATVTDTIPTGLTIGTLPAGCTAAGQTVTCTVAAGLAAGASTSFVIPVTPTAAAQPSVTNTATVSGGGDATCPAAARCSSAVTTPVNAPQLTMTKTASSASFIVGTPASYTLSVQNTGTAATTAVATITDTIPAGLTIGTLPAGCTAAGQTVTCTVATGLAAGGSTGFTIPVTPTLAAGASVTNTATVSGGGDATCPAAARCSSSVTTPVNAPQLTMTKTASSAGFIVGTPASYTLSVQNTGSAATTAAATITDTIPAGLTIGTLPAGCTAAGQTVTCTIAAGLAAGASTSFVIPVTPTAAAAASVTNTATISGGGDATCPADARCSSTVTTPVGGAQLTMAKTASSASFIVGTPASYTLSVQNTGTAATTAVATITDTVPAGLTIGTLPAGCTASGQTVTCTIAAGLAVNATASFVIPVTPTAAAQPSVTNTATVSGGGDPACPADARCSSTVTTPVVAPTIVANDDGPVTTPYTTPVTTPVLGNDTATNGTLDPASVTVTVASPNGTTSVDPATGAITFTPAAGFAGTTTYTYQVCLAAPNGAVCDSAVVTVVVGPDAQPDSNTTPQNTPVSGSVTGNDTFPAGSTFAAIGTPVGGTVVVNPDGTYTFTPAPGFTGTATFDYTVCLPAPNQTVCDTATVSITVNAATLVANDDGPVTTPYTTPVTTPVLGNDVATNGTLDPASVTVTVASPNGTTSVDPATGAITFTPAAGFAGTTTYTYQVCLAAPNGAVCDSAVVTVVVGPDAQPDSNTTPQNTPVSGTVTGNDTFPAGSTFAATGTPVGGTVVVNPDGTYTFTPAPGFTGTATFDYTVCLPAPNGTVCDTATVSITVNAATIVANDDGPVTTPYTTPVTTPVLGNDVATNGTLDPASVTVTVASPNGTTSVDPATGAITFTPAAGFAGTTTYTYQVCLAAPNGAVCDSAVVTVVVGPDAQPDSNTTPQNTPVSGTVTGNDTFPAGSTFAAIGTPVGGSVVVNPDGTYTFTPAPGFTGTATFDYTVCLPAPNGTVCDTATVSITVNAATIVANDDGPVTTPYTTPTTTPVLGNDVATNGTLDPASVTVTVASPNGTTSVDPATGAITFTPAAGFAGTTTYTYQVCLAAPNGAVCDTAVVTVVVGPDAQPDSNTTPQNTPVSGSVTGNDTFPAGSTFAAIGTPVGGSVVVNPDGTYTFTPAPGFTGTATFDYTVCLPAPNGTVCDTATVSITVNAATIVANDDGPVTTPYTTPVTTPVLGNDVATNGTLDPASVTVTVASPNGTTSVDPATGAITFTPAAGFAGTTTYTYQVCLAAPNGAVCDTAVVTVVVQPTIDANDDTGSVASGATGGTAVPNVLVNDTTSGQPATLANVTLTQISTTNPGVTLDPATGAVNVAPGTPAGTYTLVYQICTNPATNPATCDTATVTVTVAAAQIDAVDDTGSVASGATGGTAVPNVLVNDTLDGQPATLATVTIVPVSSTNPGVTIDPATGAVNVAPGTPAGTYTLVYQICEQLNPTNCDTATVTVTVGAASIVANDDTATTPQNTPVTISVLGNDTLGGAAVTPADVTVTQATPPANGTIVINPDGTITYTPNPGFSGNDTFTYQICETLNPTNCAVATVTVTVLPNAVVANDDTATTPQNTPVTSNVLGNDTSAGAPLNPASVTIVTQSPNGTAVANPDGTITFTPAPGFSGTTTYTYQVCDTSTPTPVCDQAVVTVTVPGNVVTATDDTVTADPEVPVVITVVGNDTTTGAPLDPNSLVVVTPPANGTVVCQAGACTYTSNPGFTGTDTFTYRVCDTSAPTPVCDTATVTVEVQGQTAVRLTKQATPRDVRAGDLVRYTVTLENTGDAAVVDGTLLDTPPAGFTYVDGSLDVADRDGAGRLVGTTPIRVDQIDIAIGGRATVTYLLRVGAGVRGGMHVNSAQLQDGGQTVSNIGTASVQLVADPTVDDSLILGTVFDDRDGDGWQDSAKITGLRVQGGFAPGAYVAGSTTVDRGAGAQPEADASAPLLHGIALGGLAGRQSEADPSAAHAVVVSQTLTSLDFTDDFVLTTEQGVTVRMDAAGNATVERAQGDAARGLTSAVPSVERKVSQVQGGYRVDYVIANEGVDERGIPGVRIASVEGLLMETDQYGRYHVVGIDGGRFERGRNFILKVDPATLPPGTTFTTDNPLVRRITPGLPVRFDFGVKLPPGLVQTAPQAVELELGEVLFAPDSAQVRPQYAAAIDRMAEQVRKHGAGEVVIAANGESQALAYDRAKAVRDALLEQLSPEEAAALTVSLRTDAADPGSLLVSLGETPVLGTVLFDTDKSEIKAEYAAILDKVADDIEALAAKARGDLIIGVVGKADVRGGDAYNVQLGLRRAKAVYEALATRLSPEVRARVRVETSEDPTAPVGLQRR